MSERTNHEYKDLLYLAGLVGAVVFTYAAVVAKLCGDWWSDENYSHGLLVPFVIAYIVWREWETIQKIGVRGAVRTGGVIIAAAALLLFAGTLGAELFTQRVSLVLTLAGIIVYLYGTRLLGLLAVPFALLLLSIPIPQIFFNRIAFPLQIWASQMAVWGIRLFSVPTLRNGNVIDILPRGSTQTISLEVVEACSGIRSLMTLVTLALILAYFTRRNETRGFAGMSGTDLVRAALLMAAAVPIAVITNAGRVTATGVLTYYYGRQATSSTLHEVSGWLVYVVALLLVFGVNQVLRGLLGRSGAGLDEGSSYDQGIRMSSALPLIVFLAMVGLGVNWFATSGETQIYRRPLSELPSTLGDWRQKGEEIRFDESVDSVLRTSDYTMREYTLPNGRLANLYVGYYASQRTGATYHSPQNCLPGAGWIMKEPQYVDITTAGGRTFRANLYLLENGPYKEVMIYWYQGRGRIEASEYADKLNTIRDSVTRRRTDGAIVRVMTSIGSDERGALAAAADLAGRLEEELGPHVPE